MVKFLFKEESVGHELWVNRFKIVKLYFKGENNFIQEGNPISKADFDIMTDALDHRGQLE